MELARIYDDWLSPEERGLLGHLDDIVSDLARHRVEPGERLSGPFVRKRYDVLREHGWLDFSIDDDVPTPLYYEAIKRVHRRDYPLTVPVVEVWGAARVLKSLSGEAATSLLEDIRSGSRMAVLAIDDVFRPSAAGGAVRSGWVPAGDAATTVLTLRVDGGIELFAVPAGEGRREAASNPDPTLPAVVVDLAGLGGSEPLGSVADAALDALRAEILVAQASAMVGQAQALLASTISYLTLREQFGVPIGTFQALRHRAADLATDLYTAQQVTVHAAQAVADHEAPLVLGRLSKALAGRVAMNVASEAIQLHGGMGFAWEGSPHFGFKRCTYLAMSGDSLAQCESALGRWVVEAPELLWPGGLTTEEESRGGKA